MCLFNPTVCHSVFFLCFLLWCVVGTGLFNNVDLVKYLQVKTCINWCACKIVHCISLSKPVAYFPWVRLCTEWYSFIYVVAMTTLYCVPFTLMHYVTVKYFLFAHGVKCTDSSFWHVLFMSSWCLFLYKNQQTDHYLTIGMPNVLPWFDTHHTKIPIIIAFKDP